MSKARDTDTNRREKPHGFLLDQADDAAQKRNTDARDVDAIQSDFASQRLVQAHEHGHHGGLAAARRAHDARQLSGRQREVQPFQNRLFRSRRVQKRDLNVVTNGQSGGRDQRAGETKRPASCVHCGTETRPARFPGQELCQKLSASRMSLGRHQETPMNEPLRRAPPPETAAR